MLRYTSTLLITHGYVYCYKCIEYEKEMLVSDDKNHMKVHWECVKIIERKNKKSFFSQTFFNMDILLNIPYKALKFWICSYEV